MNSKFRYVGKHVLAARECVGTRQFIVVFKHIVGNRQDQLRYVSSIRISHCAIGHAYNMKNHVRIGGIGGVKMAIPICGIVVYLHIAYPQGAVNKDFSIEEVGAGIVVVQAWADHLDKTAVGSAQFSQREYFVLPDVMQ